MATLGALQAALNAYARRKADGVAPQPAGFPLTARSAPITALPSGVYKTAGSPPGSTAGSAIMPVARPSSIPTFEESAGTPFGPPGKISGRPSDMGPAFLPYTPPNAADTYIEWVKGPIGPSPVLPANTASQYQPTPMRFPGDFFSNPEAAAAVQPRTIQGVDVTDANFPPIPRPRPSNAPQAGAPIPPLPIPPQLVPGNIPNRAPIPMPPITRMAAVAPIPMPPIARHQPSVFEDIISGLGNANITYGGQPIPKGTNLAQQMERMKTVNQPGSMSNILARLFAPRATAPAVPGQPMQRRQQASPNYISDSPGGGVFTVVNTPQSLT